jgi:hypothetical protein
MKANLTYNRWPSFMCPELWLAEYEISCFRRSDVLGRSPVRSDVKLSTVLDGGHLAFFG